MVINREDILKFLQQNIDNNGDIEEHEAEHKFLFDFGEKGVLLETCEAVKVDSINNVSLDQIEIELNDEGVLCRIGGAGRVSYSLTGLCSEGDWKESGYVPCAYDNGETVFEFAVFLDWDNLNNSDLAVVIG